MIMSVVDEWCISVFSCRSEQIKLILPDFYHFVNGLEEVKSTYFLIRDRSGDEAVFSFRTMMEPEKKSIIRSKIAYKLGTLLTGDKFAIDPDSDSPFKQYVAWEVEKRIAERGLKFEFTDFLCGMSKLVVEMFEKG